MQGAAVLLSVAFLVTATAATDELTVSTNESVNVICGETVTLPCSIDENLTVIKYYWSKGKQRLCEESSPVPGVSPDVHCERPGDHLFVLIIPNVQPSNNGTYFCTVLAGSGHGKSQTALHVSECIVNAGSQQTKQEIPPNRACASVSVQMPLLLSLTALLLIVLDV